MLFFFLLDHFSGDDNTNVFNSLKDQNCGPHLEGGVHHLETWLRASARDPHVLFCFYYSL